MLVPFLSLLAMGVGYVASVRALFESGAAVLMICVLAAMLGRWVVGLSILILGVALTQTPAVPIAIAGRVIALGGGWIVLQIFAQQIEG